MNKVCEICGSNKSVSKYGKTNQYLCSKHKHHMERYGFIKNRTRLDKNEIILHDDYAEMFLYNKDNEIIGSTFINTEDIDKVKDYKWCLSKHKNKKPYVVTSINGRLIPLHRFILDLEDDEYVDHRDRNTLNNRRNNLRDCTIQENNMNLSISRNNTSGVTGVCWHSQCDKWRAYIMLDYKQINLGLYDDFQDAVDARQSAELKYFGEYSPLYNHD